jgi:hypothetical protein
VHFRVLTPPCLPRPVPVPALAVLPQALVTGRDLCAAPRLETAMLDKNRIGLALGFEFVIDGGGDKFPQLLRQAAPPFLGATARP